MDSPVRKMLKRNDYNRHKLLRKIKRRRKAEMELLSKAAEKELKRRLKVTPPNYKDGKDRNSTIYPTMTSTNYDDYTAQQLGYTPASNGHLPSRDYRTGDILKYPSHPTFLKALLEDARLGFYPVKDHKKGRSRTATWKGNSKYNPELNKYEDGKDKKMLVVDGDHPIKYDEEGNLIDQVTGQVGTMQLDPLYVKGSKQPFETNLRRAFELSEIWNGHPYPGHGALETVSPEFDILTMLPLLKTATKYGASKLLNQAQKVHIGNYYLKPQYNNFSYIRQVGDDAIADMMRTGQMRTTDAIFDEQYAKLVAEVGEEEAEKIMFPDITDLNSAVNGANISIRHKNFNRNMFYTGRPFYAHGRYNYIITKPRPITKQKDLAKKGLEWIEDGHKGHTRAAKAAARNAGLDPNTAPGRIVDPVYNGDTNIIPMSEFGPFELYRPVSAYGFKLPFYRRTSFK